VKGPNTQRSRVSFYIISYVEKRLWQGSRQTAMLLGRRALPIFSRPKTSSGWALEMVTYTAACCPLARAGGVSRSGGIRLGGVCGSEGRADGVVRCGFVRLGGVDSLLGMLKSQTCWASKLGSQVFLPLCFLFLLSFVAQ
jgi:hypothetical protein